MSRRNVKIYYGSLFRKNLAVNDGIVYNADTADLFGGPEFELLIQETLYETPFLSRTQIKQRVFSIWWEPHGVSPFSEAWYTAVRNMYKAMYNPVGGQTTSPVRIYVDRPFPGGVTRQLYLEAQCEQIVPINKGRDGFTAKFTAPDPFFILSIAGRVGGGGLTDLPSEDPDPSEPAVDGPVDIQAEVSKTMSYINLIESPDIENPNSYTPVPITYTGTAPTRPIITFKISSYGGVYQYYEDWTITNPSSRALRNYPVCLDLGNIAAQVGTKWFECDDTQDLRDIRVETLSGLRKFIYVRDSGNHGGTWHQSVKVWVILNSLEPGETKTLRMLHGNPLADPTEIYPDQSAIKHQMNGYASDNNSWVFSDFAPVRDQPQTRSFQWSKYQPPGAPNLAPIDYLDNRFLHPNLDAVPCAGARVLATAPVAGSAGFKIYLPLAIDSIAYNAKYSTNAKCPLVMRWQHRDGRWEDGLAGGGYHADANSVWYTTVRAPWSYAGTSEDRVVPVVAVAGTGSQGQFVVGQEVQIYNGYTGETYISTITGINVSSPKGTPNIQVAAAPAGTGPTWAATGAPVHAAKSESVTLTWPDGAVDAPQVVAFVLRGDAPQLNSGIWYYGGAEQVTFNFAAEEALVVTRGAEVDLAVGSNHKFQLTGKFGNPNSGKRDPVTGIAQGEWVRINTITHNLKDMVVIDCTNHTCYYYAWDSNTNKYLPGENRYEALSFDAVDEQWIHVEPDVDNKIQFLWDPNSYFHNNDLIVSFLTRYYS